MTKYPAVQITESMVKEYRFTEGSGLVQYTGFFPFEVMNVDQFLQCCKVVLEKVSESLQRGKLACIYLGLKMLDMDNRDSMLT